MRLQPEDAAVLGTHRLEKARSVKPAAVVDADDGVALVDEVAVEINGCCQAIITFCERMELQTAPYDSRLTNQETAALPVLSQAVIYLN